MVKWFLKKLFGSKNQREVKRLWPLVLEVNANELEMQKLTDAQLQAKTEEFKKRLADGATLDQIMPEAFATVKNACRRLCGREWTVRGLSYKWDMVPFAVQVLGGMVFASRQNFRDGNRRRQDARGHHAGLPQRARR